MLKKIFYAALLTISLVSLLLFKDKIVSQVKAKVKESQIKNSYIVVLKDKESNASEIAEEMRKAYGLSIKGVYKKALKGYSAYITPDKIEKVKKDPRVKYIASDQLLSLNPKPEKPGKPDKPDNPGKGKKPKPSPSPEPSPTPEPSPSPSPTPEPTLQIRVVDPNGGETLQVGETYRILWEATPDIDKVTLSLMQTPYLGDYIATDLPNTGYYDWEVGTWNTSNTQFKIQALGYDTGFGSVYDSSDDYFTILPAPTPTPTPTPSPTPTPTPTPTPSPTPEPSQVIPTGISRIGLNSENKGSGVVVAVIDTGIDPDHPDLAANIITTVDCMSGVCSAGGEDDNGHGTHVAGTIAALDNEIGVVGVAPEAKLVAVKVLDNDGHGTFTSVIAGIDWTLANVSNYNIKIANMSLGGSGPSDNACGQIDDDPLHEAICNTTAAGITFVVSAGNSEDDVTNYIPANYDDTVITVSALVDSDGAPGGLGTPTYYGNDDTFASFSNYGSQVDLGGPGVYIYSTFLNGDYRYSNGTSMSAPHVSGAAALYLKNNPGNIWSQVRDALVSLGEAPGEGHTDPDGLHPEPVVRAESL